jgi:hypothetical protein
VLLIDSMNDGNVSYATKSSPRMFQAKGQWAAITRPAQDHPGTQLTDGTLRICLQSSEANISVSIWHHNYFFFPPPCPPSDDFDVPAKNPARSKFCICAAAPELPLKGLFLLISV